MEKRPALFHNLFFLKSDGVQQYFSVNNRIQMFYLL